MNVTTRKNTRKSCKGHSNHSLSSLQEADDSALRDYELPIPSGKGIPSSYERNNDDDKKYEKFEGGDILVIVDG